jgi:hypothetical protein
MIVAAAAPIVLPSTLVLVNCVLQSILLLIKTVLAAMVNEHLLIMFFSSVLVGASAGVGYNIGVHLVAEYKKTEVERLAAEYEEEEDNEDAGTESPSAPPWPPEEKTAPFMEPPPMSPVQRIKTPSQMEESATPPVVKADLTGPETPPT